MQDFNLKPAAGSAKQTSYGLDQLKLIVRDMSDNDALLVYNLLLGRLDISANSLNLLDELAFQYRMARMLQAEATDNNSESGMKDRTVTLNSVTSLLKALADTRAQVLTQERLKRFEVAIRKTLKTAPAEMREAYVDLYGEFLEKGEREAIEKGNFE